MPARAHQIAAACLAVVVACGAVLLPERPDVCSENKNVFVPPNVALHKPSGFTIVEGGLSLYPNLTFPCDGALLQWRFVTRVPTVYGLNLAVFRWSDMASDTAMLIGTTLIDYYQASRSTEPSWAYFRLPTPIPVRQGDFLGVFYENLNIPESLLASPARPITSIFGPNGRLKESPVSYVLPLVDADAVRSMDAQVRLSKAIQYSRVPSIIAVMRPSSSSLFGQYFKMRAGNARL